MLNWEGIIKQSLPSSFIPVESILIKLGKNKLIKKDCDIQKNKWPGVVAGRCC